MFAPPNAWNYSLVPTSTGDVSYKVLEIAAGAQVNGVMTRVIEKAEVVSLEKLWIPGEMSRCRPVWPLTVD